MRQHLNPDEAIPTPQEITSLPAKRVARNDRTYKEHSMTDYTPKPEHKFTFGLWTVGNIGADPFGGPVREPKSPADLVRLLGEVGAHGVNFHDTDLIPIDATPSEAEAIKKEFRKALEEAGVVVPMATTDLFRNPVFKDGAFTSNDPKVRAYALQKTMNAIDLGVEFGAKTYVFWGGREGTETDAAKDPIAAIKRSRGAMNFLCEYVLDKKYDLKFALEAKPNEPRGDIYNSTTGHMLAFIQTLDHPEMVGVNPEVAHEHMAGLNFVHGVAQAIETGKLFHIDLNDQAFGRYDQDFRFGAVNLKSAFFLVKLLEDNKYDSSRHFDAHAYRTEDYEGVKDFARGCMRTYLILKEKAARWNADKEIQEIVAEINADDGSMNQYFGTYSSDKAEALKAQSFDRSMIAGRGLKYERLDQLTVEILLGVR